MQLKLGVFKNQKQKKRFHPYIEKLWKFGIKFFPWDLPVTTDEWDAFFDDLDEAFNNMGGYLDFSSDGSDWDYEDCKKLFFVWKKKKKN